MKRTQALRHLFHVMERTKTIVPWQVAARVTLTSLYLDNRISTALRDELDELISSGELLNHDEVIRPLV